MKVALLISGHLRCWKQNFPYIEKTFLDKYNPDVFISTWDNEGWWQWNVPKGFYAGSPEINEQEVANAFKPKFMRTEKYDPYDPIFAERSTRYKNCMGWPKNVISMFYKWVDVTNLMRLYQGIHGVEYDMVIRYRSDLQILGDLPEEYDLNNFYIVYNHYDQGGLNDVIYIGNYDQVTKATEIGLHLDSLYSQTGLFCTHILTEQHFKNLKFNVTQLQIPYRLHNTPWGQHQDVNRYITKY